MKQEQELKKLISHKNKLKYQIRDLDLIYLTTWTQTKYQIKEAKLKRKIYQQLCEEIKNII